MHSHYVQYVLNISQTINEPIQKLTHHSNIMLLLINCSQCYIVS